MAKRKQKESLTLEEKLEAALVPEEEQPYEVPGNWCWVKLLSAFENLTDSKKKIQTKQYEEVGAIPIIDQGQEFIGGFTDDDSLKHDAELPVIVFGDHTRCVKYIDFSFAQGADGVKVLKPYSFYDSKAFYYALQSIDIPNMGYRRHYPLFKNFSIPLPPLPEQHRIVERIESLFSQLDEARDKAQEALDDYEARNAALYNAAFSGDLTRRWREDNDKDYAWNKVSFDEVADIQCNLVEPAEYQDFPHIAPDNIEKRTGVLLDYNTVAEDKVKSGKHRFYPGQILYSKIRPYLSKVVMIDFDGLCSADMYPIRAKGNTKFLYYQMLSDDFLEQASSAGSRSVLPKINQKELSRIKMVTTSEEEQEEVARVLDDILPQYQTAREAIEMVIEKIENLKKSILAKAFRGVLGTNDPEDESAIELLKRVLDDSHNEQVRNDS